MCVLEAGGKSVLTGNVWIVGEREDTYHLEGVGTLLEMNLIFLIVVMNFILF